MSDTYTEVKAIIKDLLGADEAKITPEARFREELEADSLDLVELMEAQTIDGLPAPSSTLAPPIRT